MHLLSKGQNRSVYPPQPHHSVDTRFFMKGHTVPEPLGQKRVSGSKAKNLLEATTSGQTSMKQGEQERQQEGNQKKNNLKLKRRAQSASIGLAFSETNSSEAKMCPC